MKSEIICRQGTYTAESWKDKLETHLIRELIRMNSWLGELNFTHSLSRPSEPNSLSRYATIRPDRAAYVIQSVDIHKDTLALYVTWITNLPTSEHAHELYEKGLYRIVPRILTGPNPRLITFDIASTRNGNRIVDQ